jgi:hypothetical protein
MSTKLEFSFRDLWDINIKRNLINKFRLFLGRLAVKYKAAPFYELYANRFTARQRERLSPEEVANLTAFQVSTVGGTLERRSRLALDDAVLAHPATAQDYQRAALWCRELLAERRGEIRSMINVGARVDIVSSYLAPLFQEVEFISLDFQPNLAEHNAMLPQSPNWRFISGYALDLFESRQVTADLVLFASTACLFTGPELRHYLAALSRFAKYLVFEEAWSPPAKDLRLYKVIRPEDVDPNQPYLGGKYNIYHHNYLELLKEAGFGVLYSRLVPEPRRESFLLELAAYNRLLAANPSGQAAGGGSGAR